MTNINSSGLKIKVLSINACSFGSTGRIMLEIAEQARKCGIEAYTSSSIRLAKEKNIKNHFYFDNTILFNIHRILGFVTGFEISFSFISTINLLSIINRVNPDIIHLHNIHGWYVNSRLLFSYLKKHNIKIVWTFHDCWPFTGHCPHFEYEKCEKWKNACFKCPRYNDYPKSLFDNSNMMYQIKKNIFTSIDNLTIVTPSNWLNEKVRESFLKNYCITTINNGIDTNIFKPTESSLREKWNIANKFVLLGVASGWSERKGFDVFVNLAKTLDMNRFSIIMVGLSKKRLNKLPSGIIGVLKTEYVEDLVKIYSIADVFINPTKEDNFPTVNLEALACGIPVITYNTGGSSEVISNKTGCVILDNSFETLVKKIIEISNYNCFLKESCREKALKYNKQIKYKQYVDLYRQLVEE